MNGDDPVYNRPMPRHSMLVAARGDMLEAMLSAFGPQAGH
jgi:hypothetical protein